MPEETKKKISDANFGRKRGPLSEEHKRKLSDIGRGRKQSEETKQKRAETKRAIAEAVARYLQHKNTRMEKTCEESTAILAS